MPLTIQEQTIQALKNSQKPLIVFKKYFAGDSLAAALALFLILKKLGKKADIVCDNLVLPRSYRFLPQNEIVQSQLRNPRKMIISIDETKTKVEDFSYDLADGQLKIYITPKNDNFGPQDVKATLSSWLYDLIITIDTPELESLGKVYTNHRDFFYEKPIINIDYSPANEQYGQINLVDLTASSSCGVIYNLIQKWDEGLFDADINTCLLTGIIDKTKGFKTGMISPKTLNISSQLIENNARRAEIVKNLYYNRDLSTLKLWGKILLKLKQDFNGKLVSVTVNLADFAQTSTSSQNLLDIMDELISSIPSVEVIVLIYQRDEHQIRGLVKSLGLFDPLEALKTFSPQGNKNLVKFTLTGNDLALAEQNVLEEIKKNYRPLF
ncbi:MAG: DHH family phosphoesterase [Patescibacteria group bacterium]